MEECFEKKTPSKKKEKKPQPAPQKKKKKQRKKNLGNYLFVCSLLYLFDCLFILFSS